MSKYREIAKIYLKAQMAWRIDTVFSMIFTITKIIFAYLLWGVIFEGKTEVAGFTYNSMLSYYIISSFLSQIEMSGGISREITERIRNGSFSKYMVIPSNIEGYFVSMEAGAVSFYLVFDFIAAAVWIFIFQIEFVFTGEALLIICAAAMVLLGLFFMIQLNYYLGLLTLKYQEISTFLMIKDNLAAMVTGTIIPLVLFPESVLAVMRIFPFYYVTYVPSMLLIGRCEEDAVRGLIILACWCIFLQAVIMVTWRKYRRKYDGVGI